MKINGWEMAQQFWFAFIDGLNMLIPVALPDGTQIGGWILFGTIGLISSIIAVIRWRQRI